MNGKLQRAALAFCRPGFEQDLSDELAYRGATAVVQLGAGLIQAQIDPGVACLPTFARDLLWIDSTLQALPRGDRVQPIAEQLTRSGHSIGGLLVLCADSEQGRKLAPLTSAIGQHLTDLLQRPLLRHSQPDAVYVVFVDSDSAILGRPIAGVSNPWPGGIARLRMPRAAPSRSTLKLDEAFQLMLTTGQRSRWLRSGLRAVDLGAAPGGWSWQLVSRGIHVTAIDNGPMKGELLSSGLLTHLRADGFSWRPPQPVDWLVCDMVAKPARVVERIAHWLDQGWCDRALFNLKLPMQRRHQSWQALHQQLLKQCRRQLTVSARHLYHDREEITVLAWSDVPVKHSASPRRQRSEGPAAPGAKSGKGNKTPRGAPSQRVRTSAKRRRR